VLFNERVERLDRTALAKRMEKPHTLDYDRMMKRQWISIDGVTEDDVDAFVCNLRLLIQDEPDRISIRCLANEVYSLSDVPDDLRDRFTQARERWPSYMDEESIFKHPDEPRNFQNNELFDVLLYGVLAHVNPNKVGLAERMTTQGLASSVMCSWFVSALRRILDVVRSIRDVNAELLRIAAPHSQP